MNSDNPIDELVAAFCCLPGVGPKTAQRMVYYLLERDRDGGRRLSQRLQETMDAIGHCKLCRNFTVADVCDICESSRRDTSLLCVVETPADVQAIEHTGQYRGRYFVLMGNLSPIDGIGPAELGIDQLVARCADPVGEVIVALPSTVEGEATTHYIREALKPSGVAVSRIAQGIPLGGELEYIDGGTLSHALQGRRQL